jgi:hypothetical protein
MDVRIRIRLKMSRILGTLFLTTVAFFNMNLLFAGFEHCGEAEEFLQCFLQIGRAKSPSPNPRVIRRRRIRSKRVICRRRILCIGVRRRRILCRIHRHRSASTLHIDFHLETVRENRPKTVVTNTFIRKKGAS